MRLSEAKIKEGILHADPEVRDAALAYFADTLRPDPSIMPLAIEAIGKYGAQLAFPYVAGLSSLTQTDETLLWVIGELSQAESQVTDAHRRRLLRLLALADVELLSRHEGAIAQINDINSVAKATILERLRLRSLPAAACWQELEAFCEREKSTQYVDDVDLDHAYHLVEAIARDRNGSADRVMSGLAEPIDDLNDNPMTWMEGFLVRLAGEMRLHAALPLVVAKLHEDADWLDEECVRALTLLGGDEVIAALTKDYPAAPWFYRLYAAAVLETIHSDVAVAKGLELLDHETDADIQLNLGQALLAQFATETIEPVRQLILAGPLDAECLQLRQKLLAVCTLLDAPFPELDTWREELREEDDIRRQWQTPEFPVVDTLEATVRQTSRARAAKLPPLPGLTVRQSRVGRNEPCPCGSGKKYKKCCLRS